MIRFFDNKGELVREFNSQDEKFEHFYSQCCDYNIITYVRDDRVKDEIRIYLSIRKESIRYCKPKPAKIVAWRDEK